MANRPNFKPDDSHTNQDDNSIRVAIAELIRAQRQAYQPPLSQEELAYRSRISYEHLNHIENGKATPSLEILDRIAKALGHSRLSQLLALDSRGVL